MLHFQQQLKMQLNLKQMQPFLVKLHLQLNIVLLMIGLHIHFAWHFHLEFNAKHGLAFSL